MKPLLVGGTGLSSRSSHPTHPGGVSCLLLSFLIGEEDAILALHELLERKQSVPVNEPLSCDLLRSSIAPGAFTTIVRATGKEVVQAVLDALEQEACYSRFLSLMEGHIRCREYPPVGQFQSPMEVRRGEPSPRHP